MIEPKTNASGETRPSVPEDSGAWGSWFEACDVGTFAFQLGGVPGYMP